MSGFKLDFNGHKMDNNKMNFGKYSDMTYKEVLEKEKEYCDWVLTKSKSNYAKLNKFKKYLEEQMNSNDYHKLSLFIAKPMNNNFEKSDRHSGDIKKLASLLNLSKNEDNLLSTMTLDEINNIKLESIKNKSKEYCDIIHGVQQINEHINCGNLQDIIEADGFFDFYRFNNKSLCNKLEKKLQTAYEEIFNKIEPNDITMEMIFLGNTSNPYFNILKNIYEINGLMNSETDVNICMEKSINIMHKIYSSFEDTPDLGKLGNSGVMIKLKEKQIEYCNKNIA